MAETKESETVQSLALNLLAEGKRLEHQVDDDGNCSFCRLYRSYWRNNECSVLLRAAVDALQAQLAEVRGARDELQCQLTRQQEALERAKYKAMGGTDYDGY